jgi:hypothetical protein
VAAYGRCRGGCLPSHTPTIAPGPSGDFRQRWERQAPCTGKKDNRWMGCAGGTPAGECDDMILAAGVHARCGRVVIRALPHGALARLRCLFLDRDEAVRYMHSTP